MAVAVGYGAEGLFGGRDTCKRRERECFFTQDINREVMDLAPDIDLTKRKTNKKHQVPVNAI